MADLDPVALEAAMQSMFGAAAGDIHVSHIDHLCGTLTPHQVELLLRAVGGSWADLLARVGIRRAAAALTKDPGEDPRLKAEAKPA